MIAYQVSEPNGPFELVELPAPRIEPSQVLVRIHASAINPLDLKIRAGAAHHAQQPLPAVLCLDMAGVVESVGAEVTRFKSGDEVYGMVGGVGGRHGTLAEYVAVEQDLLALKPQTLSMREAAALPLVTITAWEGMIDRAGVHANQRVLVHAGAGGVGHVAVQLAVAAGAEVFATISPNKADIVKNYGATPIDYQSTTPEQYVAQHTSGEGFDIVYDTLGGSTLDASFLSVKRYTGHVVSCLGWGTHALAPLSFRGATYSGVFTLMPLLTGLGMAHHGEILTYAAKLAGEGRLRPLLHSRRFQIHELEEAFAAAAQGGLGKVVVEAKP